MERAARNLCFGFKYMLQQDMNIEYIVRVNDTFPYQVHVGGELALSVSEGGGGLKQEWTTEWGEWKELQQHPKLKELTEKCDSLLNKASRGMKGKGHSKGSGGN